MNRHDKVRRLTSHLRGDARDRMVLIYMTHPDRIDKAMKNRLKMVRLKVKHHAGAPRWVRPLRPSKAKPTPLLRAKYVTIGKFRRSPLNDTRRTRQAESPRREPQ